MPVIRWLSLRCEASDHELRAAAWPRVRRALLRSLDPASLAFIRIAFGAIMLWEVVRYFQNGWIARYWIDPVFHFTYLGFSWVKPWPGFGMYVHMGVLGILAILILVGLGYRVASALFFLGFTYIFLLDQARYLNHFYFLILLSFLLILVPANRTFSLDALFGPKRADRRIPAWSVWILRFQLLVLYGFAGIAKLNSDWLRGEPLRAWLAPLSGHPAVGGLFQSENTPYLLSYGGLVLDLLVGPLLLWRRTRSLAFLALVAFHSMNAWMFQIGIFPWIALACSTIFFEPDWPRRLWHPEVDETRKGPEAPQRPLHPRERALFVVLTLFTAWQILMPLRHLLYRGNVSWTEEGHRFSWRMKLRDKQAHVTFTVWSPSARTSWDVDTRHYLERWQEEEMANRPDMILQFAHFLAEESQRQGFEGVAVRARASVSLNGRKAQPIIDEKMDLVKQPRSLLPGAYILPLDESLEQGSSAAG